MSKLTKEQERKNSGMFIHEDLFLSEVARLDNDISHVSSGGVPSTAVTVKKINGKAPATDGSITIAGEDIIADKAVPGSTVTQTLRSIAADVSGKAESTTVASTYQTKADTTAALALKADKTAVVSSLNGKTGDVQLKVNMQTSGPDGNIGLTGSDIQVTLADSTTLAAKLADLDARLKVIETP